MKLPRDLTGSQLVKLLEVFGLSDNAANGQPYSRNDIPKRRASFDDTCP